MTICYCVRCRLKVEALTKNVRIRGGRLAAAGACPRCGTRVMRILGMA